MKTNVIGLYLEIISSCNNHCIYCYNEKSLTKNYSIDVGLYKQLTDSLKDMGINSISISGGEPFLHKNLCDFIDISIVKGIVPRIITNLTIYNELLYRKICNHSIPLQITLDGSTAQSHNFTRGANTYEKILDNLKKLTQLGFRGELLIRTNLHKKNYLFIEDIIKVSKNLGAAKINLSLVNFVGGAMNFSEIIHDDDYEILNKIQDRSISLQEKYQIEIIFEGTNASIGCPYYGSDNIKCGLRISADGYVYPCQLFMDKIFNIGNIKYDSLSDIINGGKMDNFIQLMSLRKSFIPECSECVYKCMCATGCPAEAYNKNHNIFTNCGKCERNKSIFNLFINNELHDKLV